MGGARATPMALVDSTSSYFARLPLVAAAGTTTRTPAAGVLVDVAPRHAGFDEAARKRDLGALERYRDARGHERPHLVDGAVDGAAAPVTRTEGEHHGETKAANPGSYANGRLLRYAKALDGGVVVIAAETHPFSTAALHAPVSAIIESDVGCVTEELTEEELLTFFVVRGVHAAPVVTADGVLTGFVSLVDVQRSRDGAREDEPRVVLRGGGGYALGPGFHMQPTRTVSDIMTRPPVYIEASAQLTQAAALMAFEGVARLPVVDGERRVVGVLSALDLLRWMGRQDGYQIPAYTQRSRQHPQPESE